MKSSKFLSGFNKTSARLPSWLHTASKDVRAPKSMKNYSRAGVVGLLKRRGVK